MRRVAVRSDGIETQKRIVSAGRSLFGEFGYRGVSIPQIAKMAGIRTPTFYHYCEDKQQLYLQIVSIALDSLEAFILAQPFHVGSEETLECQIEQFCLHFLQFVKRESHDWRILKESTHLYPQVFDRFKTIVAHAVQPWIPVETSDQQKQMYILFLTSPVSWVGNQLSLCPDQTLDLHSVAHDLASFACNGIDPNSHKLSIDAIKTTIQPLIVHVQSTRSKLVESAEYLFGNKGYHDTYVSDITQRAGVALGTFYVHFRNKQEILQDLIHSINLGLRNTVRAVIQCFPHRIDAEIAALKAVLGFFSAHKPLCHIVLETEFIFPQMWIEYYGRIQSAYIRALKSAMDAKEIRYYHPYHLSLFLMGIGHYLTEELVIHRKYIEQSSFEDYLRILGGYLLRGVDE